MILKEFELKDGELLTEYKCEGSITSRVIGVVIGDVMDEYQSSIGLSRAKYSTFEISTQDLFNAYSDFAKDEYTLHEDMDNAINELDKIGKIVEAKKAELIAMRDKGNYPRVKSMRTQEELMRGIDQGLAPIIEDNLKNGTSSLNGLAEEMIETWTTLSKDQRENFKKISPMCAEVMEKAIS